MQNGYYTTTGAMVTQFNKLNVISNNLANVNTVGFKRDDVVIGDFKRVFQEYQDEMPIRDNTKEAAKYLNASIDRVPQVAEQYVQFGQGGGLKSTGNNLDFALKRNDLFFMVETPQGIRLTQNGSFTLNNEGVLSTKEGYPVLPANFFENGEYITVPQNNNLSADSSGNLFTGDQNALADGQVPLGRLFMAQPNDIKSLQKEGSSLYTFPDIDEIEDLEGADALAQGFLEMSNVNPVKEMTSLIEAQRMVEMYQKVMTSHMNDMNNDAINKLAQTKA